MFDDLGPEITKAAQKFAAAGKRQCGKLGRGELSGEDDFTSRLLEGLESTLDKEAIGDFVFDVHAIKLADRGPNSPESKFGADFILQMGISAHQKHQSKGFLIQAKQGMGDWKKLDTQCQKMLNVTSASSVWIYEKDKIRVASAARTNLLKSNLENQKTDGLHRFASDAWRCRTGDVNFGELRGKDIHQILKESNTPHALIVRLNHSDTDSDFPKIPKEVS